MKTLAIIWLAVIVMAVPTVKFVNDTFAMMEKLTYAHQVQPAEGIDLGNNVCLQNCQPIQLQAARGL